MRQMVNDHKSKGPTSRPKWSRFASQSSWSLLSEVIVFSGSIITLLILTSVLTEAEYGIVGSIQGLVVPATQICLVGSPALLIRRVSRGEEVGHAWNRVITSVVIGSVLATTALVVTKPFLLGTAPLGTYTLLVLSLGLLSAIGDQFFLLRMSQGRLEGAALIRGVYVAARTTGLVVFWLQPNHSLLGWAVTSVVSHALAAGFTLVWVGRVDQHKTRILSPKVAIADAKEGYGYALTGVSESVLNASDRPILVNSGFAAEAGSYTLAARFIGMAMLPSVGFMRATTAHTYRVGEEGIKRSLRVARRLLLPIAGLNLVVAACLWIGAPLLTIIIDDRFPDAIEALRLLAFVPLIKSVQFLAGNALDGSGFQLMRFKLTMSAAMANLVLNLILIPQYGWRAAIVTTLAAEAYLCTALWGYAISAARRGIVAPPGSN